VWDGLEKAGVFTREGGIDKQRLALA